MPIPMSAAACVRPRRQPENLRNSIRTAVANVWNMRPVVLALNSAQIFPRSALITLSKLPARTAIARQLLIM